MIISVNVTQTNILNGIQNSPCSCPIALALKDLGYNTCTVLKHTVRLSADNYCHSSLPLIAQHFIEQFDSFQVTLPFSF